MLHFLTKSDRKVKKSAKKVHKSVKKTGFHSMGATIRRHQQFPVSGIFPNGVWEFSTVRGGGGYTLDKNI